MKKIFFAFVILAVASLLLLSGCTQQKFGTFDIANKQICTAEGKPIVALYSTTTCPHCNWIKETFDSTVNEYVAQGKIVAYHWQLDTGDNLLTPAIEDAVPADQMSIYNEISPKGYVPAFSFGCKYYRIGNGFEPGNTSNAQLSTEALAKEKQEFVTLLEQLLKENAK